MTVLSAENGTFLDTDFKYYSFTVTILKANNQIMQVLFLLLSYSIYEFFMSSYDRWPLENKKWKWPRLRNKRKIPD